MLNLDTSVVFLTPVLVYAARRRGQAEVPLLVGCVLLSNAASLLLPGSNLTNLIVIGNLHLSGGGFLSRMALPWVASIVLTGAVIAIAERRSASGPRVSPPHPQPPGTTAGSPSASAPWPWWLSPCWSSCSVRRLCRWPWWASWSPRSAWPSAGLGRAASSRCWASPSSWACSGSPRPSGHSVDTGRGRAHSSPTSTPAATAVVAAASRYLVSTTCPPPPSWRHRIPPHPFALLVGLDIGPNLFVSGSLAWILWWRTARAAGADPPLTRAMVLGLCTVPMAMAAALVLLAVTGPL